MLRVTIELVPGGVEERTRTIEQMTIANISDLADASDYDFAITDHGTVLFGRLKGHKRRDGAWKLVYAILDGVDPTTVPESDTQKRLAERFKA